jgi:hypothetical protein
MASSLAPSPGSTPACLMCHPSSRPRMPRSRSRPRHARSHLRPTTMWDSRSHLAPNNHACRLRLHRIQPSYPDPVVQQGSAPACLAPAPACLAPDPPSVNNHACSHLHRIRDCRSTTMRARMPSAQQPCVIRDLSSTRSHGSAPLTPTHAPVTSRQTTLTRSAPAAANIAHGICPRCRKRLCHGSTYNDKHTPAPNPHSPSRILCHPRHPRSKKMEEDFINLPVRSPHHPRGPSP